MYDGNKLSFEHRNVANIYQILIDELTYLYTEFQDASLPLLNTKKGVDFNLLSSNVEKDIGSALNKKRIDGFSIEIILCMHQIST